MSNSASVQASQIKTMFHEITPAYDRLNLLFSASLDRQWRKYAAKTAIQELPKDSEVRLLDVASGTGELTRLLKRYSLPRDAHVIGLDFTRSMLEVAYQKTTSRINWTEADALKLPFLDSSFDVVTIAFGLRNMIDKPMALAEMVRVVRPGGRVVILEFSQPTHQPFRFLYDFYSFYMMPFIGRLVSGSKAYLYLAKSIRAFWSAQELKDHMTASGLESVCDYSMTLGIVRIHMGIKPKDL